MSAPLTSAVHCLILFAFSLSAALSISGNALAADTPAATPDATAPADAGQGQQVNAKDMMDKADAAMKAGEYDKALAIYEQLAAAIKQSNNAQAYQLLALVNVSRANALAAQREFEASDAAFKEVLDQDSTYLPALLGRGKMQLEAGANDVALQSFQSAIEQDRTNVDALFGLGKAYALLNGFPQAVKPLTTVIAKDDKNAEAYRFRGLANAGIGKYKQAHDDVDKSIQLDPEPYETYFTLAQIYLQEQKYDEAAKAIGEAIKRYKPKGDSEEPYFQGYLTRAAALVEAGKIEKDEAKKLADYQSALADCDKVLDLVGDSQSQTYAGVKAATEYRRGTCFRLMGKLGDAINAFTEGIKLNPDFAEAYFHRGICFFHMNESDLALADFGKAASLKYDEPRYRLWEGFTQAKLNDYEEAIRAYGQAIAESDRYTPAYVNRGLAYMMLGEYDKALVDFDEAIRLEPTKSDHYFKRGVIYEKKGKQQEAADSFASAIKFDDKNVNAYRHAATALAALGHNDLAAEYRSKADSLAPKEQSSTR